MFQFQYGAIISTYTLAGELIQFEFQFQYGAIIS